MNIETKITPRLKMVADLVPFSEFVADVGTDHGYLPIYLVEKGIAKAAVAADVNKGPLEAAKLNISMAGMKDKISCCLSDGLESIEAVQVVTIAGMGGELIASILEKRKAGHTKFVLQPQRSFDYLRYYLAKNGFQIEKEAIAKEGERMYCAFFAVYTGVEYSISKKEALLGKKELVGKNELYKEYVQYRKKQVELALSSIERAGAEGERKHELVKLLEIYEEAENEI